MSLQIQVYASFYYVGQKSLKRRNGICKTWNGKSFSSNRSIESLEIDHLDKYTLRLEKYPLARDGRKREREKIHDRHTG
jgi:hypothetical protein